VLIFASFDCVFLDFVTISVTEIFMAGCKNRWSVVESA